MKRELRNLLAWAFILVSTMPAFSAPAPRCGDLETFVKAVQVVGLNHVVLRGAQIEFVMDMLSGDPDIKFYTTHPDHILVVMDRFENRAFVALEKGGIICDRIVVPVQVARRFMAGA